MANAIQATAKEAMLSALLNAADVKLVLVDLADYTYNAAHDFLDDVPSGARVATSAALTGKTYTGGVFNSAAAQFTSVTGDQVEAGVLIIDTGSAATSRIIAYVDTWDSGMPFTPTGGNVQVPPDTPGWFTL